MKAKKSFFSLKDETIHSILDNPFITGTAIKVDGGRSICDHSGKVFLFTWFKANSASTKNKNFAPHMADVDDFLDSKLLSYLCKQSRTCMKSSLARCLG